MTKKTTDSRRQIDVIDVRASTIAGMVEMSRRAPANDKTGARAKPIGPTPEQMRHGTFEQDEIVDKRPGGTSVTIGYAYRRKPRFMTLDGLGTEQVKALEFYRGVFDRSERSETRCALDVRPRGSSGSHALELTEDIALARQTLKAIERQIGANLDTLRAVALNDLTFSDVAIARFGGRDVERVNIGKGRRKAEIVKVIKPRSGRHREQIRAEFFTAVARLVAAVAPYQSSNSGPVASESLRRGTA